LHTCVTGDFLDLPNRSEALGCWQTLICRLLTANGKSWRKAPDRAAGFPAPSGARGEERVRLQGFKDDFTALLDENRDNDELREALDIVRTLPAPGYDNEAWESLESLMRILLRAAAEWKLVMAERGQVDYSEMAARAIESLGDEEAPTDLALRMDYRIQHLLVDEFQDTSASQIRLLEKLTAGWVEGDGHTVFLVGDPMQSIYRFRKAEVSLFIKAWQGQLLDHLHLLPLLLTVNFRSTAPVVDWVNRVFPLAMPPRDDPVTGAVSYRQAHTHPDVGSQGQVSLKVLPQRDDTEEARQAVEYIKRCNADESIAILVRVRHHANTILAELDKLKDDQPRFRYQAIKFNRLADTPLVRDLVSLTLALMQPADRLAWFSVLRAPYIGLDLADLDALVAGDSERIILDALNSGSGLSNEGRQRLQRASPILLQAVERRGRQSVRSLIEWVWISLGGPACTANASEMEDASTYFDLLDSMEDENLPIDRDSLELGMENLYAQPDPDASNKLQVLTIYEAKGLQFDTVILPGLNRRPGGDKTSLLHWFELAGEDRIVMSPMRNTKEKEQQKTSGDLIKYISTIEKQRQSLEDARLLYVAATRARKKLHLLAAIRPDARDNIKPDAASMMARLWPAVREQQETLILQAASERVDNSDAEPTATALPQVFTRFSSNWRPPELPEAIDLPVLATVEARDYIEFNWVGEDARLAGILVHRQLQLIAEHGLTGYLSSSGMEAAGNWRQHYLRRHGVQGEKARLIVDAARQAVANCLASDKGRWILSPHPQARCEYRLTAIIAGQARNLVLDRTFVDDGIRWVIDYKTSSHGGGNLEGFLANEAERYREQLHRYRVALALTESLPIKTALYFPLLDRLVEVN
ncbi:MAG: UvrD-helicase domain-containing protein, partial [Lysobacterales bacterium]